MSKDHLHILEPYDQWESNPVLAQMRQDMPEPSQWPQPTIRMRVFDPNAIFDLDSNYTTIHVEDWEKIMIWGEGDRVAFQAWRHMKTGDIYI